MDTDPRKTSVYLPSALSAEIRREAKRQDRAISWLIQKAWELAKAEIRSMPSVRRDSEEG